MVPPMAGLLNMPSPVAAPSTLGESFADRLKRLAEEKKAEVVADASGQASPGNRNTTGGLADLGRQSTGYGMSAAAEDANALGADVEAAGRAAAMQPPVAPPPAPPEPGQPAATGLVPVKGTGTTLPADTALDAAGRPSMAVPASQPTVNVSDAIAKSREQALSTDPNTSLSGPGTGLGRDLRAKQANAPITSQYDDMSVGSPMGLGKQVYLSRIQPPTAEQQTANEAAAKGTGAEALKPMLAYDQAKAQQKPLGVKGSIGLAMSIAADAFAGMAGRQGGYTAAVLGQRKQDLADATNRIQGEIDRLQAEQDKAYNKKRQERLDQLHEAEVNAQIENNKLQRAQQYEKWQNDYKLATDEHERKVLKDKMDGMAKESQAELRKATIEKLQRDGRVLAPGETYSVWDPVSQSRVVIDRNDQQVVTTTQNNETQSAVDPTTGKPISVNKSSTNTVIKGTTGGAAPKGASAGVTDSDRAAMGTIQAKIMAGKPLTPAEAAAGARLEASGVVFQTPGQK